MLLMIDNYDSFTYNLVQYFGELGADVRTVRNDEITLDEIAALAPERIVDLAGAVHAERGRHLGAAHRALRRAACRSSACASGTRRSARPSAVEVVRARALMHGKTSPIEHTGAGVFRGLPNPFTVIRYHSLAIERESLPACLEITAWTADGEIMGVRHREHMVEGVQFHPESFLTEHGHALLKNFLES